MSVERKELERCERLQAALESIAEAVGMSGQRVNWPVAIGSLFTAEDPRCLDVLAGVLGVDASELLTVDEMTARLIRPSQESMLGFLGLGHPHSATWFSELTTLFEKATGEKRPPLPPQRPRRILLLEVPDNDIPLGDVRAGEAVQGSMSLLGDADEAFVFRGDKAAVLKHRDRAPDDVHVAIQRRPQG